jgi:hypothetical protein
MTENSNRKLPRDEEEEEEEEEQQQKATGKVTLM